MVSLLFTCRKRLPAVQSLSSSAQASDYLAPHSTSTESQAKYIKMTSAFDDEDLSMSLAHPNSRRGQSTNPIIPNQSSSRSTGRESSGPPPPQTRSSQRLGQYDVKKTLGEGSFGKVKLAVHRISGQQVALKIISRRKLISRDMAGRVEREIQYLQLLRHPHIIKL